MKDPHYRFEYTSDTGGPYVVLVALEGGFDGGGLEFNSVDGTVGVGKRIGEGIAASNPDGRHDDITLVSVQQTVNGDYDTLWHTDR